MKKAGRAVAAALIGGVALVVVLAAGGAVLAAGKSATTAGKATGIERPHLLAGAIHGDGTWQLVDGTTRTTRSDLGVVTAVGDQSITILRADGESVTAPVDPSTCIREDGRPAVGSDLQAGERALVTQSDGATRSIRAGLPPREKDRQGCGFLRPVVHGEVRVEYADGSTRTFAYDPGRITQIGAGQVSLRRRDGQTVTLGYDESTVVVEEGQPGTVDDLHPGDGAMFVSEGGKAVLIRCVIPAGTA